LTAGILDQLIRRGDPIAEAQPRQRARRSARRRRPRHALAREVTDMLCRAHRALGETELPSACLLRGDE
jgi:hypothetical protein